MMIMRCSRSRVKLGLIFKIHRHYKHPGNKFSISVRGSCPISNTALEVITKLFALLCYFKESGCDDGLGISLPCHTRCSVSGDHLWMFITKLTKVLSSIPYSLSELTLFYRKPQQLIIWSNGQFSGQ